MVQRYFACLSRETEEIGGGRIGLEFEVVEASNLNCFLNGQADSRIMSSEKYREIFRRFKEFGVADERFREMKVHYLGETGFHLVTVYFDNLEYERFEYENWYLIQLSDDGVGLEEHIYNCAFYEWKESGDPEINAYCNLFILPESQAKILKQLYYPYIPEESRIEGYQKKGTVGAVTGGTIFGRVEFFYVGAALCVKIIDNVGNLVAFFDLGTRISMNPLLVAQGPAAANSRASILADLLVIDAMHPLTIFISHWHVDHCNALGNFVVGGVFANPNISNHTEWYVPASGLASFLTMQAAIPPANFHIAPQGVPRAPVNVNGNRNIQVGKINLAGNLHPHHQGIYVMLTLASGTSVFLTGDTTFEALPAAVRTNRGAGYDVLQACHHGGDYYLPPANQVATVAEVFIPTPAAGAFIVYSADGVYHGHPLPFFIQHYQNRGYAAVNEVYLSNIAAAGNNLVWFS